MARVSPFAAAAALLSAIALAAATRPEPVGALSSQPPPNLVVFMTDDQTVESLRVMPNVRRLLAREGTTFENAFASFPVCCPSRATFLTGQYAHNHGVMSNHPPRGGSQKLDHLNTLGLWLQAAGYRTVHLGKYLNGYGRDISPLVPGAWSEWYGSLDPSTYNFVDYDLMENGRRVRYGPSVTMYQTDVYGRKGADFVRRLAGRPQPFFLFVGFLAPHVGRPVDPDDPARYTTPSPAPRHRDAFASEPLPRPPSFNELDVSDKPPGVRRRPRLSRAHAADLRELYQQRLESLLAVDEAIARVVAELRRTRTLGRTLIVFTSDNGFMHGEHRIPQGKVVAYEPSARVPLILRGPGVPRNRVQRDLVTNVDIAPTLLEAAGADATRLLDGRSLLPLAADPGRRLGRDVLLESGVYSGIRTHRFKYVQYVGGARELYDLQRDPHELQSRHRDPALAGIRDELARRLRLLRTCFGESCSVAPRVRLAVAGGESCVTTDAAARVEGDVRRLATAEFRLAGRRLRVVRRGPYSARVPAAQLGPRNQLLRVRLRYRDGRELTVDRLLRRC
ncbi:MAG: sulfatase [Thermoleophilia bacterium]|nr:sulfatase [Thermoleophilia bacterium]